jgi:hypothetical protein
VSLFRKPIVVGSSSLTIELRIEDTTTGNAIPDALVEVVLHPDGMFAVESAMTDSGGKFQITPSFQIVKYRWGSGRMFFSSRRSLRVTADGYHQWRKSFSEIFGPTYHFKGEPAPLSYTIRLEKDDSTAEAQ